MRVSTRTFIFTENQHTSNSSNGWILAWVLILFLIFSVSMSGILAAGYGVYSEGRKEADRIQTRVTALDIAHLLVQELEGGQSEGLGVTLNEKIGYARQEEKALNCIIQMKEGWPKELGTCKLQLLYDPLEEIAEIKICVEKGGQAFNVLVRLLWQEPSWEVLDYQPLDKEDIGTDE